LALGAIAPGVGAYATITIAAAAAAVAATVAAAWRRLDGYSPSSDREQQALVLLTAVIQSSSPICEF